MQLIRKCRMTYLPRDAEELFQSEQDLNQKVNQNDKGQIA
jgi:hypothetical protein